MTLSDLVARERTVLRRRELVAGLSLAAGASAMLVAAAGVLLGHARWLTLPRGAPWGVWPLVVAIVAGVAIRTQRRLARDTSRRRVAMAIESEQGLRRGSLVGVMEMEGQGALAARAAERTRASLPPTSRLAPAMRRRASRRALSGAGIGLAGVLLLAIITPAFGDGLRAVLSPARAWRGALLPAIRIVDPPRDVVRGDTLALRIAAPGRSRLFVSRQARGAAWRVDTLVVDPAARVTRWTFGAMLGDVRIVVSDGRVTSDSVAISAADRPFLGGVTLTVDYPAYLGRASEVRSVGETLRLPRGTSVLAAGRASVPLARVALVDAGDTRHELAVSGYAFAGRLVVTRSTRLAWSAAGAGRPLADLPPAIDIEMLADSAPTITIVAPAGDTISLADNDVPLTLAATDDHGIAAVLLRMTHVGPAGESTTTRAVVGAVGTSWRASTSLSLADLHLGAGESARIRAEAVDASPWAQRGVSRELTVTRPTMEARRDAVRAIGAQAVRDARAAAAAQRSLSQRTDEAARAQERTTGSDAGSGGATPRDAKPPMNFAGAERARGLVQEQRAMADRVQKLREATQHLEQQLKAAGALDTSLARKLGEAQALLRQAITPQMLEQMQTLEQAAQRMDGEQSRDALRDLAQMQQRMKDQLEKSAEILRRAAHEGAMQTLADQARELAQRAHAVADSGREAPTLAEQAHRLREQMSELAERLATDRAEAGAARTEQAGEHAAKSEADIRRAGGEARRGAPDESAKRAREAAAEMDQAAEGMRDARAAQVREWKHELTAELDQSVQEMMQLAREERALEQRARTRTSTGTEQRGAQSAVEQGVEKASERLQGAAKKSALLSSRSQRAMSDARDRVSQATRKLAQGSAGGTGQQASALGDAADALTKAAAALARDRERANGASSASGFSEMLREMQQAAQRQGRINGQAQNLFSMPGGAAGEAGQSLARSLARQQRAVADQLEDAGDAAGGTHAAQLAQEARQLADQLDGGRVDAATLARQQQLFRRLLDAGRALEKDERDDSGKREARTATGTDVFAPATAANPKGAARYRQPTWDEMRGLSAEERRTILEYFNRLNNATPR